MSSKNRKEEIGTRLSARTSGHVLSLMLALCAVSVVGCKTPWARPLDNEPSFERLLESERKQSGRQAGVGSQAGLHTDQKRPGQARFAGDARGPQEMQDAEPINGMDREQAIETLTRNDQSVPRDEASLSRIMQQTQKAVANQYAQADDLQAGSRYETRASNASSNRRSISDATASQRPEGATRAYDIEGSEDESVVMFNMNDDSEEFLEQDPQPRRRTRDVPPVKYASQDRNDSPPKTLKHQDSEVVAASHSRKAEPVSDYDLSSANGSKSANVDLSWEDHIREALFQLEESTDAALSPEEQVRRATIARLLSMTAGDVEAAMQPIEGLQPMEQEYYRHQLKALYDSLDPSGTPVASRRWSLAMLSQRKAHENLSAISNLEVNNAAFCTSVESFGVVQEFPASNFKPDQEFLLYCEIDNFVSEQINSGGYETQLQGSYEIVDSNGRRVTQVDLPMDSHVCRNRRRDYFIAYRMHMPQNVSPGKYTLKLTIEDMKGPKFGQTDLPFQIVN